MNKKKILTLIAAGLVLVSITAFLGARSVSADEDLCRLQGSWIGYFAGGPWDTTLIMEETITPLEPNGKRLAYVMRLVNVDATFGMYPEADIMSPLIGEAVRTSNMTYDIYLIGYGINERDANRGEIEYIWTVQGELTCLDDNHKTDNVIASVYDGDADADQDGFPDEGAEASLELGPLTLSAAKRVFPYESSSKAGVAESLAPAPLVQSSP
jgi:hypothetical protein